MTSRPATAADLAVLAGIHAALPDRPHLDGVYLDRATFAGQPADQRVVPFVVNGEFRTDRPCGELTPVLWLTLRRHGIGVRGPAVADLDLGTDHAALRRYNLENLGGYWRGQAREVADHLAGLADDEPMPAEPVAWLILGPARLHHTLAYGDIVSKARAGGYLAELFPAWASLASRAVRFRAGSPETFTAGDLRAAVDSAHALIDDAEARFATP